MIEQVRSNSGWKRRTDLNHSTAREGERVRYGSGYVRMLWIVSEVLKKESKLAGRKVV